MERVWFFAYSHHINPRNMAKLGIPVYSFSTGVIEAHRLAFNVLEDEFFRFERRGMANIVPSAGESVEGVLYELDEDALPLLDREFGVQSLKYYRKYVQARNGNGGPLVAYAYAAWPDVTSEGLKPTRTYLDPIITAANAQGFSHQYRQWLSSIPTTV